VSGGAAGRTPVEGFVAGLKDELERAIERLEAGDPVGAAPLVEEAAKRCAEAASMTLDESARGELSALLRRFAEAERAIRQRLTEEAAQAGAARRAVSRYGE
jgi:hypothetical protein